MRRFPSHGVIALSPSFSSRLIGGSVPWKDPFLLQVNRSASICLQCQRRCLTISNGSRGTAPLRQRQRQPRQAPLATQAWRVPSVRHSSTASQDAATADLSKSTIEKGKIREELPSEREARRRPILKKIYRYLDSMQEDLAEVTQRFNKATGMDYSSIAALRAKIEDQEKHIESHHATIMKAKSAVEAADTQRAAAQKEVVGLLERKHSWTSSDLERYMSLIRSEHVNDQAVSVSKENLRAAETALELARSKMEQMVASQYHEETLLNDTIRRNSTWVTVGLMGFNVFLLLASLVIIEPWRRKRLVREIRLAFDEQSLLAQPHLAAALAITPGSSQATDSSGVAGNAVQSSGVQHNTRAADSGDEQTATEKGADFVTPNGMSAAEATNTSGTKEASHLHNHSIQLHRWSSTIRDRFSDRQTSMRQVDITSVALQGATAGAAIAIWLMVVLSPR